jgi:eukaryotic-like serine/threonine-protein kinase
VGSDDSKLANAETVRGGATLGPVTEPRAPAAGSGAAGEAPVEVRPGTAVGRFLVLNRLGAGATAVVFAAYDPVLDRKVALKFVHPDAGDLGRPGAARARLMREAQALAQFSHVNVIAIYDVGTFGADVFIAEEFVDGTDLAGWLKQQPRSRPEIVDVFLQAGRGLAAAHRAGLVHRDFKPANVLVGRDGRVRVVDFGLVRAAGEEPAAGEEGGPGSAPEAAPVAASVPLAATVPASGGGGARSASGASDAARSGRPPSGPLAAQMTVTGALIGTPLYMAPEQFAGLAADARSDQFSFCVALYEALCGERPFAAETWSELKRAVLAGDVRPLPRDAGVPTRLRRVLLRGLRPPAAERYPSMAALLDELGLDPAARRRPLLLAVAALLLVGGVVGGQQAWHARRSRPCQGAAQRLVGVWDAARKDAVRLSFQGTGKGFAAAAWLGVERALDERARVWATMHRDACEATLVRGEQSAELLDRRMLCLRERLDEIRATVDILSRADSQVVEKAVQAAQGLAPVAECADVQALTSRVRPPRDPATRERLAAARQRLAAAAALDATGKFAEAAEAAAATVAAARQPELEPVRAEALALHGRIQFKRGDSKHAAETLREAVWTADRLGDDPLRARAALALAEVLALGLARPDDAEPWVQAAEAAVRRGGDGDLLRGLYHHFVARVRFAKGRYPEALELLERAVAERERALGPDHLDVASSVHSLGVLYNREGRFKEAIPLFERALRITEKALGPDHPDVAPILLQVGDAHYFLNEYPRARAYLERCLALRLSTFPPDHPFVATARNSLANVLFDQGEFASATEQYRLALEQRRRSLPPEHTDIADSLFNLGLVNARAGNYEEARRHLEGARAIYTKAYGAEHSDVGLTIAELGDVLLQQGKVDAAVATLERAVAIVGKARGKVHRETAAVSLILADALVAHRDYQRAAAILEVQVVACGKLSCRREETARGRFALARAVWELGQERPRALQLAAETRLQWRQLGGRFTRDASRVERWEAARR